MRNHFQQFSVINEREQTTKRSQQNCFLRKAVAVSIWDQFLLSEGARIAAFFTNVLAPNYHLATRYPTKSIIGQQLPGEFMTLNPSSPNTFSFAHWLPIEHKQQRGAKRKNKAKSTISTSLGLQYYLCIVTTKYYSVVMCRTSFFKHRTNSNVLIYW